jgi:hypothetical protein
MALSPVTSAARLEQEHETKLKLCRETTVESLVTDLCIKANYLTKRDIQERTQRYLWVLKITKYCEDATALEDVADGVPIEPMNYLNCDKIMAEKQLRSKAIVTIIAKEIIRFFPHYQG